MSLAPFPELITRGKRNINPISSPPPPPILIFLIKFCDLAYTGGWVTFFPFFFFLWGQCTCYSNSYCFLVWASSTWMEWLLTTSLHFFPLGWEKQWKNLVWNKFRVGLPPRRSQRAGLWPSLSSHPPLLQGRDHSSDGLCPARSYLAGLTLRPGWPDPIARI